MPVAMERGESSKPLDSRFGSPAMQAILAQANAMIADGAPAYRLRTLLNSTDLAHPRKPVCVGACCLLIALKKNPLYFHSPPSTISILFSYYYYPMPLLSIAE